MGATTIWERWDGIRPDGTFETPTMNSYNHYAYGAIGDWMYRVIAGIDTKTDGPGYKQIVIKPTIGGKLQNASADYETNYGKISSHWKVENGNLALDVEIPANTTASIYIPADAGSVVLESGAPVKESAQSGYILQQVGSGSFYIPYKKVKGWAWESFWIVGGIFSWLVVPPVAAWITIPGFAEIIKNAGPAVLGWTYLMGLLWGIGGLTYGLGV
eukprot:gene36125-46229_t